jgi:hypothetical protein
MNFHVCTPRVFFNRTLTQVRVYKRTRPHHCRNAFKSLELPLLLDRVAEFNTMLKLFHGPRGVYIVHFRVVVHDVVHQHAIMFRILEIVPGQRYFATAVDNNRKSRAVSCT